MLGLVAASMLTGCSSDEVISSPDGGLANQGGMGVNSDVEIRLSSSSKGTRSSVESTATGFFEANGLGIFCLAYDVLTVNPDEQPIDWNRPYEPNTNYSVWMENVEANAVYEKSEEDEIVGTNIKWAEAGKSYWYPVGNWYCYKFYGYYPRVENDALVSTESQRYTVMELDGTQDVIWGCTEEDAASFKYSAKFFRMSEENAQVIPSVPFKHLLMRYTFSCTAGADAYGSTESAKKMKVKSIIIKEVPNTPTFIIADRDNKDNEGTLSFDWSEYGQKADFVLKGADDTELEPVQVADEKTVIGQGVLLPVPEDPNYRYGVDIVLVDDDGNEFVSEHPIQLRLNTEGGVTAYKAGTSYNINLTIHGPQEIYLNATLAPWELDDDSVHDIEL